eukprot:c34363_g1_i1 orf=160-513(+)
MTKACVNAKDNHLARWANMMDDACEDITMEGLIDDKVATTILDLSTTITHRSRGMLAHATTIEKASVLSSLTHHLYGHHDDERYNATYDGGIPPNAEPYIPFLFAYASVPSGHNLLS